MPHNLTLVPKTKGTICPPWHNPKGKEGIKFCHLATLSAGESSEVRSSEETIGGSGSHEVSESHVSQDGDESNEVTTGESDEDSYYQGSYYQGENSYEGGKENSDKVGSNEEDVQEGSGSQGVDIPFEDISEGVNNEATYETSNGDVSYQGSYEAGGPNEGSGDGAGEPTKGVGVTPQFPVGTINPTQKIQRILYGYG